MTAMTSVTTVSGSPLSVLGKVWLNFVIKSDVFPFEAYVIKDLTHDVVLGRDFLQKYCSRMILWRTSLNFPTLRIPSPLLIVLVMIWMLKFLINVFCQCKLIILLIFPLNQKSLSLVD